MLASHTIHALCLVSLLTLLVSAVGCSGGGDRSGPTNYVPPPTPTIGRAQFVVDWQNLRRDAEIPSGDSRYIPVYANSVKIDFSSIHGVPRHYSLLVKRPANGKTETVNYPDSLPVGSYHLTAIARTDAGSGTGSIVSSTTLNFSIRGGDNTRVWMILDSTLHHLTFVEQPVVVKLGSVTKLAVTAVDAQGKAILVPDNAIKFSLLSGSNIGRLDNQGNFTALKEGIARVRATETGAGLRTETEIHVLPRLQVPALADSTWPKFGANAANTGQSPGVPGSLGNGNARTPPKWRTFASRGTATPFVGSPAITADGMIIAGAEDGNIYAIDPATGAKIWTFVTHATVDSSPAIASDGTIYVGSFNHNVYALDPATGAVKWTFTTGSSVASSPAIGPDGTVYVGSRDQKLYALNPATGEKKWEFATGDGVDSSPALGADGTIYVGSNDTNVYAVDPATGREKWHFTTGDAVDSSPVVGPDGMVYIESEDGFIYALNGQTGAKKWSFNTEFPLSTTPALAPDGSLYVGNLVIDAATGARKRTFDARDTSLIGTGIGGGSPAISGDGIVWLTSRALTGIDSKTGTVKVRVSYNELDQPLQATTPPVIGLDGTIYIGTNDGALRAYNTIP